jgi:hypothetical protein
VSAKLANLAARRARVACSKSAVKPRTVARARLTPAAGSPSGEGIECLHAMWGTSPHVAPPANHNGASCSAGVRQEEGVVKGARHATNADAEAIAGRRARGSQRAKGGGGTRTDARSGAVPTPQGCSPLPSSQCGASQCDVLIRACCHMPCGCGCGDQRSVMGRGHRSIAAAAGREAAPAAPPRRPSPEMP